MQDIDLGKIINIIKREIDSINLKKNLYILFALFFAFTLLSEFKTKRYFITNDGALIRNVETFWGQKVVQFELEKRDGRWFARSFERDSKWFQINDENEDFYNIESETENRGWFD
jgi:hydroxymethylpyrimidine pyrophosphatase-like HAD family hydrolase